MTSIELIDDPFRGSHEEHMWPWDPNDFMNIEDYLDAVGTTTVRRLLGNPVFLPVAEIPAKEPRGKLGGFWTCSLSSVSRWIAGSAPHRRYIDT